MLCVYRSSSPEAWYLLNGLMIKCPQWCEQKLHVAQLHGFALMKTDLATATLSP